jgi:membrane protease YdiL (CAAX protease family)
MTRDAGKSRQIPSQIASWWHLAGNLLITAGIAWWGFHLQSASPSSASAAAAGQLADHSQAIKNYLIDIAADCALLYYCWVGVHWFGVRDGRTEMETLTGGKWLTWKGLGQDVAIALPFWVIWEATAYGMHWILAHFDMGTARSTTALLPQSPIEVALWIVVSIVAGVTEEIQARGYLQKQLHALSGSLIFAVIAQGVAFGLGHSYQGWKQVMVISVLGILYGVLAAWRRNLRANMIAHAWSDVWEGWLKMVLFR